MAEMVEQYTYIVVGGGIAGVTCAEHLYILHPEATILLITSGDYVKITSNVKHLTKTLDSFDVEEKLPDSLTTNSPSVRIVKDSVARLDSVARKLHTHSQKTYSYNKLCICTGAVPKSIAENNPYVLWIRDTESVQQFQSRIQKARRIVIVGNGGIATEMVYALEGLEVVWAIKDKSINSVFMDSGAAQFLLPRLTESRKEEKIVKRAKFKVDGNQSTNESGNLGGALGPDWHAGMELRGTEAKSNVILEKEVEISNIRIEESGDWPVTVVLNNGKEYACDFIVSATGVVPNTSVFTKDNNFTIAKDGGLLVDDSLQTSIEHVFAAGDVCTCGWDLAEHWLQMRLWTQARQMGSYAAKSMWSSVTGIEIFKPDFCFELFTHATKFFGQKVILLGLFNGQKLNNQYEIWLRMTEGQEYIKCIMVGGRMQGAILVGETGLEETFENLILNQMDLSVFGVDLLDPDIDIDDYFD